MKRKSLLTKLTILTLALVVPLVTCCEKVNPDGQSYSYKSVEESSSLVSSTSSSISSSSSSYISSFSSSSSQYSSSGINWEDYSESAFESYETNEYVTSSLTARKTRIDESDIYQMMADSLCCSLEEIGYRAFVGYAVIDIENSILVPGIGYTAYQFYTDDEEINDLGTIYSCGFYQMVLDESEICITDQIVKNGVPVIPESGCVLDGHYIISVQTNVKPFSGIYLDKYFSYQMISDYVVSVSVKDNNRNLWDENIDLYDFDNKKYVFKADMGFVSPSAVGYYQDEYAAYCVARDAYEQIVRVQDQYGFDVTNSALIIFSEDVINHYLLTNQIETLNQFVLENLRDVTLREYEYIMITESGVSVETTKEYQQKMANERLTNGIIAGIAGLVAIGLTIWACVATWGAATPIAVKVVVEVTGTLAALYMTSNLVEAGMDIYYGANGDITSGSINPLLAAFKAMFGDKKETVVAYHAFGIACSIISSLTSCFSAVVNTARTVVAITGKSLALTVTRAVLVTIAKMVVVAGLSTAIGKGVTILIEKTTGNPYAAKIAGAVSGIAAGFILGIGLNKLDQAIGLSFSRDDYLKLSRLKNISKIIKDFEKNYDSKETNARKGNYGEMKSEAEMTKNGWNKVSVTDVNDLDHKSPQGIDGIFEKDGKYIILESKFNQSPLGQTADGKEMSRTWFDERISSAVGDNMALVDDICNKIPSNQTVFAVARIDEIDFSIVYSLLDENASIIQSGIQNIPDLFSFLP